MRLDRSIKEWLLRLDIPIHGGRYYLNDRNIDIIDFSTTVNPLGVSEHVIKALLDSIVGSDAIVEYPDPYARILKGSIVEYLGIGIDKDNILVGNGSTEIIYDLVDSFIASNDKVAIVEPTFLEYAHASRRNNAVIEHILMDDLRIDDSIEERIATCKPKMLFICNPNNPTGILADDKYIDGILEQCYNDGTIVVLDESFIEFTGRSGYVKRVAEYDNLIVIRSLTKAFGLAGLRIGYCVASKDTVDILQRFKVPWSVNALAQIAGAEALNDSEYVERSRSVIDKERSFLLSTLSGIGFEAMASDTNFFLIRSNIDSTMLKEMLLDRGILVRDCSNFYGMHGSNYIRISTRLRLENTLLVDTLRSISDNYACK
jgi:threonine-phosphate decarboxylase